MRAFFVAILLVILVYAGGFLLFLAQMPVQPATAKADGIVALTGGDARLDAAVALLEKGVGQRLLITGVDLQTNKDTLAHMSDGGPRFQCCADLGYAAEDTHGNAEEAAEWAHAHHFHSLVVVTARYHMPRALREFKAAMPDEALLPWPVAQDKVALGDWWRHRGTTILLQQEYVKYLASLVTTSIAHHA